MRNLVYATLFIGVISLSGCALNQMVKLAQDQDLQVNPDPLEVHADSVSFEMSANLPLKMLKPGKVYTINTYYKYGDQEMELEPIEFKADDYDPDSQPRASKSHSFAYDPAMNPGTVEVKGVASDPRNGKSKETARMPVATGLITTSTLVQNNYYAAYAGHGYNNQEELIPTTVNFYFDQGKSNLKYSERRSERGKFFEAFIAEAARLARDHPVGDDRR